MARKYTFKAHVGESMRIVWIPEPLRRKIVRHPADEYGMHTVDLMIGHEGNYVPEIPVGAAGMLAMLSGKSFEYFGAHEITDVRMVTYKQPEVDLPPDARDFKRVG